MRAFGDLDVTVLVDMGPKLAGLETAMAEGIQRIIDQPGPGTCRVAVQRCGVDAKPVPVRSVSAGYFLPAGAPMQWINWWEPLTSDPRHVVVLAVLDICDCPQVRRPKRLRMIPLVLAVGVDQQLVSDLSMVPRTHVLHVPQQHLSEGWAAVYDRISRIRCIVADERVLAKAAFDVGQRKRLKPGDTDAAYARSIGMGGLARSIQQHHRARIHAR